MFPNGVTDASGLSVFRGGARTEYLRLLVRQLRSSKVALALRPAASGTTFAVAKKQSDRQREVWHGGIISELAVKPPHPPLLADPAGLVHLECSVKEPIWLS